jgi:hypothetical protein
VVVTWRIGAVAAVPATLLVPHIHHPFLGAANAHAAEAMVAGVLRPATASA